MMRQQQHIDPDEQEARDMLYAQDAPVTASNLARARHAVRLARQRDEKTEEKGS